MKHKKSALMQSVIALLLCVSMLVGTTFAWFTDSVVTGINTIAAGNLDVELYHTNAVAKDEKVGPSTDLFRDLQGDPILWEPGVVSYENLRVVNEGNLALAYQMAINTANENYVLDPSGAQYGLSQILKVGVVEDGITATDRAGVVASVAEGSWTTLADFLRNGSLLPEDGENEKTWGIVIYWEPGENDNLWNLNNGKQLSSGEELKIELGISLIATQEQYESDAFGSDYDSEAKAAVFPEFAGGTADADVAVDGENLTTAEVTMTSGAVSAVVPAGVKVAAGASKLTLTVTPMDASGANISLGDNEDMRSLDVHIEGVAADNTTPIVVTLKEVAPTGLNMGNYKLYHVENGVTVEMEYVESDMDFTKHNQFKYDPATGDIVLYMATFSEVAMAANLVNPWNGDFNYDWYNANAEVLTIANADQLAAFGAIVGGMLGQTQNSFAGKTVKLISDINLGDDEEHNNSNLIFYPIGYNSDDGKYEKTGVAVTTGFYNFCGTFDGNGHTISNFYQNTWEMKGDNNYYDASLQYFRDGMGLFGRVYGGTVKNLTVNNFKSDGEYTTTGVIAAYADGATFENIAITNCNPRVYNIGNGGIVGCVGWYAKDAGLKTTFKNITVDNSNKISALWGSYDVACGGIVGQYYPTSGQTSAGAPANGGISFENCHIAAQMDVYNDVCGNYQYYAYRYAGMLIGSVRENVTIDGHVYPKMDGISAENCTVHFGTWNDYYYCEFEKNGHPSYSGPDDYKFSRVPHSELNFTDSNGNGIIDTEGERASVTGCKHDHTEAEKDNMAVYLPFNNLVTGYGWGVTTKVVGELDGVTILDREVGNSVPKFESKVTELANNKEYKIGDIFTFVDKGVELIPGALTVSVTNLDENNPVSAEFKRSNTDNWEDGTLKLSGTGKVQITIQDYYFCTPTTIEVEVKNADEIATVERFAIAFPNADSLNRVGNSGTVALGKLFKVIDSETENIGDKVTVTFETVTGASVDKKEIEATKDNWTAQTVQFSGTGIIKVTISDDNFSTPLTQTLEVVDATNVTGLSGTISGNVVLLNDCGLSSLTISGRNTVYGNGFTATYTGNGQYLNNGTKLGVVNVSGNGTLDNLRINASVYPVAYLYYSEAQKGESDGNNRYFYQLSAVAATGNATITNCYIYGGRTNIYIGDGNVTVKDSVLECGTLANSQIISREDYTVTFTNVTTIQHQVNATVGTPSNVMLGAGILVGDGDKDNTSATAPKIVLNGNFKQYNWVNTDDKNAVSDSNAKMIIGAALNATGYIHTINGKTASNMGIIYLNDVTVDVENYTGLPYAEGLVSLSLAGANVTRPVYSLKNATGNQVNSDYENADKDTVNALYQPQFKYSADLGGQYIAKTDDGDEHCYREGDTIKVMFPVGDTKDLDLAGLVEIAKYNGQNLNLNITCKDASGNDVTVTNGVVSLSAEGDYTVTYTATDTLFYDKDGNVIESGATRAVARTSSITYSWEVIVSVSLKEVGIPNAYFEFDSSVQKIFRSGDSKIVQFIPFLSGLKIYDYNENGDKYLRFDGGDTVKTNNFGKITSATINNIDTANEGQGKHIVTVEFDDGGKLVIDMDVRANTGSGTHSGSIKVRDEVIYVVNNGTTSGKGQTWKIYSYKFVGNNGTEIDSGLITFGTAGQDCEIATKPTANFGDTSSDPGECVTPDTLVTLADGTKKEIQHVTYEDELLVWDFYTGTYAKAPASIIWNHGVDEYTVIALHFDDGTVVNAINSHGFFDADENNFVYISVENAKEYIGHSFVQVAGDTYTTAKLVDYTVERQTTGCYSLQSSVYNNFVVEDMFSMTTPDYEGWFDYFNINDDMKYDEEHMQSEIAKYGLTAYEDVSYLGSYELYVALNAKYLNILIGRGVVTMDEVIEMLQKVI